MRSIVRSRLVTEGVSKKADVCADRTGWLDELMDEDEEVSFGSGNDSDGSEADLDECASSDFSDTNLDSLENDQDRVDGERDDVPDEVDDDVVYSGEWFHPPTQHIYVSSSSDESDTSADEDEASNVTTASKDSQESAVRVFADIDEVADTRGLHVFPLLYSFYALVRCLFYVSSIHAELFLCG